MIEHWIIPCSLKFFDIYSHFRTSEYVVWRRGPSIKIDDIAYLYLGAPYSGIKYKCIVIEDNISKETAIKDYPYSISIRRRDKQNDRFMKLKLIATYDSSLLKWEELKKHGLGQVQIQARTDRKLQKYLDSVIETQET